MGFFSDLKEDLSQAVNEMMPEEEVKQTVDKEPDILSDADLSAMLDQVEEDSSVQPVMEEAPAYEPEPEPVIEEPVEEEFNDISSASEEVNMQFSEPEEEKVVIPEPATMPEPTTSQAEAVAEYLGAANATKEQKQVLDETAVITHGMEINGDVSTQGSLDLVGAIVGNVTALGKLNITGMIRGNAKAAEVYAEGAQVNGDVSSDGAVKVGQSTVIIGNISATSAVIAGAVKGDIDVRGPVILDGTAIVMGDIKSKYVQINNGAVIEGMCSQCYADVNPTSFFEELKKSF